MGPNIMGPNIMGPKIMGRKIMDPKIMDPMIMDPKIMDPKIMETRGGMVEEEPPFEPVICIFCALSDAPISVANGHDLGPLRSPPIFEQREW